MLKHFKKYYRPGMISLLLIPIVFIPWSENLMDFVNPYRNHRVIGFATLRFGEVLSYDNIALLPDRISDLDLSYLPNPSVLHYYTERDLVFATLKSHKIDKTNLDKVIGELSAKNRKEYSERAFFNFGIKYALKVKFDDKSTYGELVTLLDFCNEKGIDKKAMNFKYNEFIFLDDFSSKAREDSATYDLVDGLLMGDILYYEEEPTYFEKARNTIDKWKPILNTPNAKMLLSAYLILLFLAIFKSGK